MPIAPEPLVMPVPPPVRRGAAWRFFLLAGVLGVLAVYSLAALWRREPEALFWTAAGYFAYEVGVSGLLVTAAWLGIKAEAERSKAQGPRSKEGSRSKVQGSRSEESSALSVLIAAHNERGCIVDTLESVFSQAEVDLEVIVASDGSTDGMNEMLTEHYGLVAGAAGLSGGSGGRLRLLALPKVGKGGALNAALAAATRPLVATLDADTRLAPGALAALAGVFENGRVVAAGGFVYVRNAGGGPWLVRCQYWEYVKNFLWRIGLAHLGVCLQVSGAFGAFRTEVLRELGGFDEASLVEDYEIIYRLHERLRRAGRDYRVAVAPGAAYTDAPDTVASFLHQRTRWFTGFLQTLWEYRRMVGDRRMGAVGWFMLPIKCVDAILPLWGSGSLLILLAAAAGGSARWQRAGLLLFAVRWAADLALSGVMWGWHRRLFPGRGRELAGGTLLWHMATEGLAFNWFRQVAVLRAYGWFWGRVKRWEQPRWGKG